MTIGRIVKSELKKHWPKVKFSVKSDYNSVRVSWTDGPSHAKVHEVTSKYSMGRFDGMTDSYEYSNRRDDVPQVSYVFLNRDISEHIYQQRFEHYKSYYQSWETLKDIDDCSVPMQGYSPRGFIRHELSTQCFE